MTDRLHQLGTTGPIDDAGLRTLHAYWRNLCRGQHLPRRADIDPRRIEAVLPNAFVLERIAPGLARFRVAGTHLADLMGMDVRGMPVSCLIRPSGRERFANALTWLFEGPATLDLWLTAPVGPLRGTQSGRMMLLPLLGDRGDVDRALGCLISTGATGHRPHRFDLSGVHHIPLGAQGSEAPARPVRPPLRGERPWLRLAASDGVRLPSP